MGAIYDDNKALIEQRIESERENDFDTNSAYGEIIDNAEQANAKNIKIEFFYSPGQKKEKLNYVVFGDDGEGMSPEILEKCLSSGFSSRYDDRDGIGRFGVGMTKAFMNQCLICEVYSKQKNKDWHYTIADISEKNLEKNLIPTPIKKEPPKDISKLTGKDHGTLVVWKEHDKIDDDVDDIIDNFDKWVGRTYRKFIDDGKNRSTTKSNDNNLNIFINGNKVKTIDPSFLNLKNSRFPDDEPGELILDTTIDWPVDKTKANKPGELAPIRIKITKSPLAYREGSGGEKKKEYSKKFTKIHQDRLIDDEWQGISILRNNREVFFGIPFPWVKGINFSEPAARHIGFEISFHGCHDTSFTVKNIKVGAKPIKDLKKEITDAVKHVWRQCLQEIKDQWEKYDGQFEKQQIDSGISTGHEKSVYIANNQPKTKDKLTANADPEELVKAATSLLDENQKARKPDWEAKWKKQPYDIIDSEWKGSEFAQVKYTLEGAIMKYNLSHPLHRAIRDITSIMDSETDPEILREKAIKLKTLIDLILLTYCKSEKQRDPEEAVTNVEYFLEDLRTDWGKFLERYIRDEDDI